MSVTVYSPRSQCEGKTCYERKTHAKQAARHVEHAVGRMRPYRCPHCDFWHLGHPPKARK